MGQTIAVLREQRGLDRDSFAAETGEDITCLEEIERGEVNAEWGTLRDIARALSIPLDVLVELAEECAPGEGGEEWRGWTREVVRERESREAGEIPERG